VDTRLWRIWPCDPLPTHSAPPASHRRLFSGVLLATVLLAGAGLAGCGSSSKSSATTTTTPPNTASGSSAATVTVPKASGPVDVLYAASLQQLMNTTIGPAFTKASGATFSGFPAGSSELANQIKGHVRTADVFLSASPTTNASLEGPANGDWVSWYTSLASAPLVLGYNPHSRFVHALTTQPWYQVIDQPGFRVGRTDPTLDPKGQLTVKAIQQAEPLPGASGLSSVLASSSNVFPEESLVGNLQSGQLDAGFFYSNEAKAAGIPTVLLHPVDLSAAYTVTVVNRAPHEQAAVAFVAFLYSSTGQTIMRNAGLTLASPPALTGPADAVPAPLRPALTRAPTPSTTPSTT
jgi:molybdate/tungstate transport system substrate-binding protein